MTDITAYIHESLKGIYPAEEVSALTRLIVEHVCDIPLYKLLLSKDTELSEPQRKKIADIVARLQSNEPIQYILQFSEFYGLSFQVSPSVLIPRPETEELVELILKDRKGLSSRILDVGTGSGCIALSLAYNLKEAEVTALDVSVKALAVARKNAERLQTPVNFLEVDILNDEQVAEKIPAGLDVIVSNPPYVPDSDKARMEKNVLDYEPSLALFVSDDNPLLFYKQIARVGREKLKKGGCVYVEIHSVLGKQTADVFRDNQYKNVELIRDLSGRDRIVKAEL